MHVLRPSLSSTLHAVVHTENTPPLWYVLEWAITRVLGTGAVALRLLSALAGVATVPVAWAIGRELSGTRAALAAAAFTAVNPLFVWYSQEARAYSLFVLFAALAMLCFLRAERAPTPVNMAAFAVSGSLALLTHYFAVFLLVPMVLLLLAGRDRRRVALPAIGGLTIVGLALLPLISAQGGHGTQWIGRWALTSRLQAIPQYYLTGYSGAPLGHGVELLVAIAILAGVGYGLWRVLDAARGARRPDRAGARRRRDPSADPARRARRRLPRAAQPGGGDGPGDRRDRRRRDGAAHRAHGPRARRRDRARISRDHAGRRSQPAPAARELARGGPGAARGGPRTA